MIEFLRRDLTTSLWTVGLVVLLLVSAFFAFPAPLGVAFIGAVTGSVIAFIAIGLVLIYRTNRIINFAQAEIGSIGMVVGVLLVVESGWNWFAGVGTGILIALALGALIEFSVIRRFFKAPRLILTVATIGLTQLLVVIRILLPQAWDVDIAFHRLPSPVPLDFSVADPTGRTTPVLFDGNHLIAILSVPLVVLALTAFFKYTSAGVASRAVADNAERASLLGIPVKRISTIVWIVAAGLSALGAVQRAGTIGLPIIGQSFDPGLLVRALAPAVIGGMQNLRTTFVASVVLGIIDATAYYRTSDSAFSNLILFAAILGALILRRRGRVARGEELEGGTWQAVKQIRPIPRSLHSLFEVRAGIRAPIAALVGLLALIGIFASELSVSFVSLILIFGIIGGSLVILTGWAGQVSLGQVAFFGVGAAITGKMAMENDANVLVALVLSGLVGALVAAVIGLPALRIQGLFLAASTVSFALFVSSMVLNPNYFGWLVPRGRLERPQLFGVNLDSERPFFFMVLLIFLLVIASIRSLRQSRTGRVLIGSRDNERAARAFSVNVTAARLSAFALSGFYAALAGGLYALHVHTVNASAFDVDKSLQVFVMVVIGGLGSMPGAILGATYFYGTQFLVSGLWSLFLSGAGVLFVLMIFPGGLGQIMYGWRDGMLRWTAKRKGIVVPSLVADVRVDESVLLPGASRVMKVPK